MPHALLIESEPEDALLLGLIQPEAGDVQVLGLDARRDPNAVRARLGYAAEGPGRLPGLSGLESVAYAAELCGLSRRHALLRGHDMLDLVGLDEARHRPVETYSTGMHQRVKVAMALVHDPDLVLLDEPTSGLDPASRDELLDLVVHLRDGGGPAVLLSTHLLHDVERTCDTVIIMREGAVLSAGNLDELQARLPSRYELRLKDASADFEAALRAQGVEVIATDRPDVLEVGLPAGAGADLLWGAASQVGARIFHLAPQAHRLESIFLETTT